MKGTILFFILTTYFGLQLIGIKKDWKNKLVSKLFLIISLLCFPFFLFSGIISVTLWWEIFHWYIDGVLACMVLIVSFYLMCIIAKGQ